MKFIINLHGGPGSGKSTTAAHFFHVYKSKNKNIELVREYIKDWVWEGRKIQIGDQSYMTAKQARKERILLDKNDYIVTDSPLWMGCVYERMFEEPPYLADAILEKQLSIVENRGFTYLHFFIERIKKFNPIGRMQNEKEAIEVDKKVIKLLNEKNVQFKLVPGDARAIPLIEEVIEARIKNT